MEMQVSYPPSTGIKSSCAVDSHPTLQGCAVGFQNGHASPLNVKWDSG